MIRSSKVRDLGYHPGRKGQHLIRTENLCYRIVLAERNVVPFRRRVEAVRWRRPLRRTVEGRNFADTGEYASGCVNVERPGTWVARPPTKFSLRRRTVEMDDWHPSAYWGKNIQGARRKNNIFSPKSLYFVMTGVIGMNVIPGQSLGAPAA